MFFIVILRVPIFIAVPCPPSIDIMKCWSSAVSMLGECRKHWPRFEMTLIVSLSGQVDYLVVIV